MNSTTSPEPSAFSMTVTVFARAPVPGHTKTRLIPALGAIGAARLHEKMLRHTLQIVGQSEVGPLVLAATDSDHEFFTDVSEAFNLSVEQQSAGDLGARMLSALHRGLVASDGVCIVGSDCPALSARDLRLTVEYLRDGVDVVIGPSTDGGYYLIAMTRAHHEVFSGMVWSTSSVLRETTLRAERCGLTVRCLRTLTDIDTPENLHDLPCGWSSI